MDDDRISVVASINIGPDGKVTGVVNQDIGTLIEAYIARSNKPVQVHHDTSEADLLHRAELSVSKANWEVGECASIWTRRFSRGRSDADFAALVSLSTEQVFQRRRVWETFSEVFVNYPTLKWGHFYAALKWDDSAECLKWADDVQANVAEMKAWRRAQRGEDLDISKPE